MPDADELSEFTGDEGPTPTSLTEVGLSDTFLADLFSGLPRSEGSGDTPNSVSSSDLPTTGDAGVSGASPQNDSAQELFTERDGTADPEEQSTRSDTHNSGPSSHHRPFQRFQRQGRRSTHPRSKSKCAPRLHRDTRATKYVLRERVTPPDRLSQLGGKLH